MRHNRGEAAGRQSVGVGGGGRDGVGALGEVAAEVEQHSGDVDLHGAGIPAGAAQGGRVGQVFGRGQTD